MTSGQQRPVVPAPPSPTRTSAEAKGLHDVARSIDNLAEAIREAFTQRPGGER